VSGNAARCGSGDVPLISTASLRYEEAAATPYNSTLRRSFLAVGLFTGFVPYLAIPIGNSSGLQLSEVLLIIAGLLGNYRTRQRLIVIMFILTSPMLVSLAAVAIAGDESALSICVKSLIAFIVAASTLIGAAAICDKKDLQVVVIAVSAGIFANGSFGIYQIHAFTAGHFPLASMYGLNRSFASPAKSAAVYVQYVRRPFGLFSEPSAMAATVGPWALAVLVLFAAKGSVGSSLGRFTRLWVVASIGLGLLIILLSRSGFVAFVLLLVVAEGIAIVLHNREYLRSEVLGGWRRRAVLPKGSVAALAAGIAVVVTGVLVSLSAKASTDSSWIARGRSITAGVRLLIATPRSIIVGVGPGQSSHLISSSVFALTSFGFASPGAIDSLIWQYCVENGAFGCVAILFVLRAVITSIRRSSDSYMGIVVFVCWFIAMCVVTGYSALTPTWLLLGMLLSWNNYFPPSDPVGPQPVRLNSDARL
jgi:hypothetical protein